MSHSGLHYQYETSDGSLISLIGNGITVDAAGKGLGRGGGGGEAVGTRSKMPTAKTAQEKKDYPWRPTEEEKKQKCDVPGCKMQGHSRRTNASQEHLLVR